MTINKIKKISLQQFIEKGYEGTSLSDIAQGVGIKKQSIYSHFKNKDELFLTITKQVIGEEIDFLHEFFTRDNPNIQEKLESFIFELQKKYTQNEVSNMKFMLRMAYMPPLHLKEEVINSFNLYFSELEYLVNKSFSNEFFLAKKSNNATLSFMTMLDGLLVALIYGGIERFKQKFEASWGIYWCGLLHT